MARYTVGVELHNANNDGYEHSLSYGADDLLAVLVA